MVNNPNTLDIKATASFMNVSGGRYAFVHGIISSPPGNATINPKAIVWPPSNSPADQQIAANRLHNFLQNDGKGNKLFFCVFTYSNAAPGSTASGSFASGKIRITVSNANTTGGNEDVDINGNLVG